jgi:Ala-tRNA(Pro) deacylase
MRLRDLLDQKHVPYEWTPHDPTYTSQALAAELHRTGHAVVKPVLVEADGRLVLCAIPAPRKLDPGSVRKALHVEDVRLASEETMREVFEDCELGAEPPIGKLYHLHTLMDDALTTRSQVTFQAGTHRDAITMSLDDYIDLAEPTIASITYG